MPTRPQLYIFFNYLMSKENKKETKKTDKTVGIIVFAPLSFLLLIFSFI